jgi:hypothetical protein
VGRAERDALLELLGLYGVGVALELVAQGTTSGAALLPELRARSGMAALDDLVLRRFTADADALKADAALLALERLAYAMVDPDQREGRNALHDAIEEVRVDPSMHRLLELRALQETASGLVQLPDDLAAQLPLLGGSGDPAARLGLPPGSDAAAVQQAALDAAAAWKRFRNDGRAGPDQQWVADVMGRTCEQLWLAAGRQAEAGRA